MFRTAAAVTALVLTSGFAPVPVPAAPQTAADARRCFPSEQAYLIRRPDAGVPVYVRVRTGQTLEISTDAACVDAPGLPNVSVRPFGPEGASLCLGDDVHLDVSAPSVIARTCAASVVRVVPEQEVAGIPGRVRP